MDLAITFAANVSEDIKQAVTQLLSRDGCAVVQPAETNLILFHVSPEALQHTAVTPLARFSSSDASRSGPLEPGAASSTSRDTAGKNAALQGRHSTNLRQQQQQCTNVPAGTITSLSPAEMVLLGISCLEAIKASPGLCNLLHKHGFLEAIDDGSNTGGSSSSSAGSVVSAGNDARVVLTGPAGNDSGQLLLSLLQRCGLVTSVIPLHDPAAIRGFKRTTWRHLLAPADEFRSYFGNQIGFYLSFLNCLALWLLAPAAVSFYLTCALHKTTDDTDSAGAQMSSPLIPAAVVFHLLWSAVGLKFWWRQEAGLNHRWKHTPAVLNAAGSSINSSRGGSSRQRQYASRWRSKARAAPKQRTPEGRTDKQHRTSEYLGQALQQQQQQPQPAQADDELVQGYCAANPQLASASAAAAVAAVAAPAGPADTHGSCVSSITGGRQPVSVNTDVYAARSTAAVDTAAEEPAVVAATVGVVGRMSAAGGVVGGRSSEGAGWEEGLSKSSLQAPTATGVRKEYTGEWQYSATAQQPVLLAPIQHQMLRLTVSVAATAGLLLAATAVLLFCLNLQGYIPAHHTWLHMAKLARLSQPGGWFGPDSGLILSQIPLAVRVMATSLLASVVYGPAVKFLTELENHRTMEGYAAALTAKQAALQTLFTFAPVTYVGLAGAGAAAARAEVAAVFKVELLRRLAVEFIMPWVMLLLATRQRAPGSKKAAGKVCQTATGSCAAAESTGSTDGTSETIRIEHSRQHADVPAATLQPNHTAREQAAAPTLAATQAGNKSAVTPHISQEVVQQALADAVKPSYDIFADFWDLSRDLGYITLFAAVYPPAAVLCLLFTMVKIKQDCLKLLVVYQRPVPLQLRGISSWNAIITAQVFLAVLTNVFLSGLTTGQLVQALPTAFVPHSVKTAILAAAANRPAVSTAANQTSQPVLTILQDISSSTASAAAAMLYGHQDTCPNHYAAGYGQCALMGGWDESRLSSIANPPTAVAATALAAGSVAAADHLLLLFTLEHVLLMVMLLIVVCIPSEPAMVRSARRQQEQQLLLLGAQGAFQVGHNNEAKLHLDTSLR